MVTSQELPQVMSDVDNISSLKSEGAEYQKSHVIACGGEGILGQGAGELLGNKNSEVGTLHGLNGRRAFRKEVLVEKVGLENEAGE